MRRISLILFSFFFILAASDHLLAQQKSSASQVISFGVVRSSAAITKAFSSSGSPTDLYARLENVPAKITVSPNVAPSDDSGKMLANSTPTSGHSQVPTLHLPSLNDVRSQMDVRILLSERRPLHFGSSPLIVTITD